ncbi:hypothetical protein Tco_1408802, partial [Tanacetum coccineum]
KLERAITTAASLDAEQASGGSPMCQEAMEGSITQTRSERVPTPPYDSPLPRVNTLESDDGSMSLQELTVLCTTLSSKVESLEADLKQTTQVYGASYTKLIMKGSSIIEEIDQDAGVTLVTPTHKKKAVSTGSGEVSTASRLFSTTDESVSTAGASMPVSTVQRQERADIQATIEADEDLAQRIQAEEREKYSEAEKARLLTELINQRKRYFIQQRAEERRNKPLTQAQQRTYMSNYIKHIGSHTLQQLKRLSFDELKALVVEIELDHEGSKKQKSNEALGSVQEQPKEEEETELPQEDLQQMMMVVPVEEVYVEALQVKYPIIDWEVYSEDTRRYWKIIRVGNHTKAYQIFAEMMKKFDRDNLVKFWDLFKERFSTTESIDDKEKELWVEMKKLFEPDNDDILWKLQRYMHDPLVWRLYDTCCVHHVSSVRGHDIFMLTRSIKTSDGLAAIQAQLNNLGREIKKVNEKVYAAEVGRKLCKGPHYSKDCPLKEEGRQYRAAASGFYQRNNVNPLYQERRQSMEESLSKFISELAKIHEENSNMIKEIRASTDATIRNQGDSIKTLDIQIGQMSKNSKLIFKSRQATIPFPSRLNDYYYDEKKELYGEQFLEAYSYGASHINNSIPRKEKDPGSFTLPCYINNVCFENALTNLGANVNVTPLSTYLSLGLDELAHTKLTVELADRTVKHPKGIVENVLVGIGKFIFPVDFIILDMPEDVKVPLILGRKFLSTAHAKIDVFKKKITLSVGDEKIIFKSVKPASSFKRVYMLSLRERMELDLEARLIGETLKLNRSLDPLYGDYIELNDLNVPLEFRRDQVDDLMPTVEEVENMDGYRDHDMGDVIFGEPFYKASCVEERRFDGLITIHNGNDNVTYQMARSHPRNIALVVEMCILAKLIIEYSSQLSNRVISVGIKSHLNAVSITAILNDVNAAQSKLVLLYKVNAAEGLNTASDEVSTAELVSTAYLKEFDTLKWDQQVVSELVALRNFALMANSSSSSDSKVSYDSNCSKSFMETVKLIKSQNDQLLRDLEKSSLMVLGYKTGLESVEEKLEFYKKNESVYIETINGLKWDIQVGEITIGELKKKLEKIQKEKDSIQFNVDKFENVSKSLDKLIECQIVDNCKKGLGYEKYNAVPPPYTGNLMPPTPDLSFTGLDDFVNKSVVKNSKAKSSEEEPKVVRKNDDALVIEEWVSDSEEENVSQTKTEKKIVKHSIAKIEFVKPKQQEKTARKTVKQVEKHRQNTHKPRGN